MLFVEGVCYQPAARGKGEGIVKVMGIDHVALRAHNIEKMAKFYCEVLGCSVERSSSEELGMVQLRAGHSLIDLVAADGLMGKQDALLPGGEGRNLHHFCVRVDPFEEDTLRGNLERHGAACGDLEMHYGAEGMGPALYFLDPEGNTIEFKGPINGSAENGVGLVRESCEACRPGAPRATEGEIAELSQQIPEWKIEEIEGVKRLQRSYSFPAFAEALAFTNRVGQIAEREGHHPDLLTEFGKVTVTWWSHKIKGIHRNDFIMAAKTDELYH